MTGTPSGHRSSPLDLAVRALRNRERSRSELDARLADAGFVAEERTETLDTLERLGYLDDARFARLRAEALAARGRGDDAIRFELAQNGVGDEHIALAIEALEPEAARAGVIADRLGGTAKTAAALARKGFRHESIVTALGDAVAPPDDGNV